MSQTRTRTFSRAEFAAAIVVATLAFLMVASMHARTQEKSEVSKGISNCRQIITGLRIYASDHGGRYPDAREGVKQKANTVFREMFIEEVLDNEQIFGCPFSPYAPDGNIGEAPAFSKAVQPKENHWVMTAGITDSTSGGTPLVFENPANTTWPPTWNTTAVEKPVRGRVFAQGIIIGMNDSGVSLHRMQPVSGEAVGLLKIEDGKDVFELAIDSENPSAGERSILASPPKILDIEE